MIKNVHLGIFINEYDKTPYLYRELKVFDDAIELDRFMEYFNNNKKNEVRLLYDEDISEYFLDNITQIELVEDVSKKKFNGRLSAYYFDNNNRLQFLPMPKPGKAMVRDYKMIPDMEQCIKFLQDLFDETDKKINKKYNNNPTQAIYLGTMCEKFRQVSYDFSGEELRDLRRYCERPTERNKKECFRSIRTNVRRVFLEKAQKEYEKTHQKEKEELLRLENARKEEQQRIEFNNTHLANDEYEVANEAAKPKEETLTPLDSASELLRYNMEQAKESDDKDKLYLAHDLDELIRDTNIQEEGRRK